jgi:hypothetical protein
VDQPGAFMQSKPPQNWKPSQFGHMPLHWIMHLTHGFQIVGYYHPEPQHKQQALDIYLRFVRSFHLKSESKEDMDERLLEDRIEAGTVVS